jgi:hypothetical protein
MKPALRSASTPTLNVPDDFRRFCVIGSKGMAEGDFIRNFFKVHDARTRDKLIDTTFALSELSDHYGADEQMARDIAGHMIAGQAAAGFGGGCAGSRPAGHHHGRGAPHAQRRRHDFHLEAL